MMETKKPVPGKAALLQYLMAGIPIHPEIEKFTTRFLEAIRQHALETFPEESFIQSMHLTCCEFPHCTDYDTAYHIALSNLAPFHFDDVVAYNVIKKEILNNYDTSDNIFIRENRFVLGLMEKMPQFDLNRYKLHYELWKLSVLFTVDRRPGDESLFGTQDYINWRFIELGHQMIRSLLPYSLGYRYYVENELQFSLALRPFEINIFLLALYVQDLFSYHKESEEIFISNVLLLAAGGPTPENVQYLTSDILKLHEDTLVLKDELITCFPEKSELIAGIYNYAYGTYNFYNITRRYDDREKCYKFPESGATETKTQK